MDRDRIEKLQAQVAEISAELEALKAKAEPEWVPFPGEIIEYPTHDGYAVRIATGEVDEDGDPFAYVNGESNGVTNVFHCARPLSDPNVIQLRPHKAGDPIPCKGDERVLYRIGGGMLRMIMRAGDLDWSKRISWAPVPREARVTNREEALSIALTLLYETQPPAIQESLLRMAQEHFDGSRSLGGFPEEMRGRFYSEDNPRRQES